MLFSRYRAAIMTKEKSAVNPGIALNSDEEEESGVETAKSGKRSLQIEYEALYICQMPKLC